MVFTTKIILSRSYAMRRAKYEYYAHKLNFYLASIMILSRVDTTIRTTYLFMAMLRETTTKWVGDIMKGSVSGR